MRKWAMLLALCLLAPCALAEGTEEESVRVWRGTVLVAESETVTLRVDAVMPEDAVFPEDESIGEDGAALPDAKDGLIPNIGGELPPDAGADIITFTLRGETKIWTYDGEAFAEAAVSDIAAGDVLLVEMTGDTVTRVVIQRAAQEDEPETAPSDEAFSA